MEVNETKFLGVVIDNRFKWSSHLGHISNKISKGIGVITKVRKFFDQTTLMSLYNSLIFPYIMYCVQVWGSAYETHLRHLTHWGRVTHICVSKLTIIGSDNGLSPGRRQAIIWTNSGILLIRTLGTNFSEILGEIHSFSFLKMHLKMASAKWRLFGLCLNELMTLQNKIVKLIADALYVKLNILPLKKVVYL